MRLFSRPIRRARFTLWPAFFNIASISGIMRSISCLYSSSVLGCELLNDLVFIVLSLSLILPVYRTVRLYFRLRGPNAIALHLRFNFPMKTSFFSRAFALSAVAALGAGLMLAGCGGGGSGPNNPNPTPTPRATATPTPTRQFTPNYINDIATLRRWRQFPVRVAFVRNGAYSAAAQKRALDGFNFWLEAIPNGPTLTVVPASDDSDITVTFYQFNSNDSDVLGTTRVFSSTNPAYAGTIARAEMTLGITGDNTLDIATAAHEYGHALGLVGHSSDADDLMYFLGNDTLSGRLTRADINTMLTNYNGVFPKNTGNRLAPLPGPFESVEIH